MPHDQRLADALIELVHGTTCQSGRPVVVVTVNAETLEAEIIGAGPVALDAVLGFSEPADLYAAIRDCEGGILELGRSRRPASPLQRLAATIRDRRSVIDGCDAAADRCHVHHVHPYENGGCTDLCNLCLLCSQHHHHVHANKLRLRRDGPRWVTEPNVHPPSPDSS